MTVHVFHRDDDDESSPSVHVLASGSDDAGNSFLRPIGSPSPGGSSTADDDDDDFPVSACFIRPERLSESGVSSAFSLLYQSLARSDSGDIKTREFGLTTPSSEGRFMELTEAKRPCGEAVLDAESAGRNSNDMSIEGEHQRSYQFDRTSL